jgi:hypothetical protein
MQALTVRMRSILYAIVWVLFVPYTLKFKHDASHLSFDFIKHKHIEYNFIFDSILFLIFSL